jgi:putative aminopeptidase FrvX
VVLTRAPHEIHPDLIDLLALPGVSGFEGPVREFLTARVRAFATPHVDAMGNLRVTLGDGPRRLLIVAHMDEIGFVVSGIDDDGLVRFQKVGTIDDRLLAGRHVEIHTESGPLAAVIGAVPPHHGGSSGASPDTLAIDVGATSAAQARGYGVDILQSVTFVKRPRIVGGTRLNCRAIDDRLGCALVLWACEHAAGRHLDATITFAWSVQEEVGLRGAQGLARSGERWDVIIPVDACASTDGPNHPRRLAHLPLGRGPVLRMVDHGSMGSLVLASWLRDLARRHDVPLQSGVTGGETDGVPLQVTGAHMVPLTIAMRYVHSLAETADLRDVAAAKRLLELVVDEAAQAPGRPS